RRRILLPGTFISERDAEGGCFTLTGVRDQLGGACLPADVHLHHRHGIIPPTALHVWCLPLNLHVREIRRAWRAAAPTLVWPSRQCASWSSSSQSSRSE